jgi:nucleotide-binding universal stress UspA family protein
MPEATAALEQRARSEANDAIGRLPQPAAAAKVAPPSIVTRHGNAGDVLIDLSHEATLLVVGSRGRGRVAGSFLGSTSAYCAHHSAVPVAIVPNGVDVSEPISQIAVGVDGSENSLQALRWALRFAPSTSIIDVYFSWMTLPIASSLTAPELDRVREASEGFLDAVVDRIIAEEGCWERSIRRHLSVGEPSAVLTASGASMIVVGARSEGGFASIVVGSPANALVHTSEAVTVLVPPLEQPYVQETHHVG